MAWTAKGKVKLLDEQGLTTVMTYDFGVVEGIDVGAASAGTWAAFYTILTQLALLSTANFESISLDLRDDILEDGTLPVEAEVPEEAAVRVHLAAVPLAEKLAVIRIPAPVDALFQLNGTVVDTTNAALIAYVAALGATTFMSDGEFIVSPRDNGIKDGSLRFRARSTK